MKYVLKRNPLDTVMIEFYFIVGNKTLLACVMHEDCIEDKEIISCLDDVREAEVELKLT